MCRVLRVYQVPVEDQAEMDLQDREAYWVRMDPREDRALQDQWEAPELLGLQDRVDLQGKWVIRGQLGLPAPKANEEREVLCSLRPLSVP